MTMITTWQTENRQGQDPSPHNNEMVTRVLCSMTSEVQTVLELQTQKKPGLLSCNYKLVRQYLCVLFSELIFALGTVVLQWSVHAHVH